MIMEALEYLQNKLYHSSDIGPAIQTWKQEHQKVVFTNGVFDILHIGHISYLAKAHELGDKLVIGLNADASVKRLKGKDRPINNQYNRALLLAALFYVDAVVVFEEDTPQQLISSILPDILVKGADYTIDSIVGAREVLANGGSVKTIEFIDGHSSTALIKKMKAI
jgi:rfaE bifunctional protein nucleotidyltransferase chain/domain